MTSDACFSLESHARALPSQWSLTGERQQGLLQSHKTCTTVSSHVSLQEANKVAEEVRMEAYQALGHHQPYGCVAIRQCSSGVQAQEFGRHARSQPGVGMQHYEMVHPSVPLT